MDFRKEDSAKFNNPLVIAEINSLASAVRINLSIDESDYIHDGNPVTLDLDTLVKILLQQIVECVPREKQQSILVSHGLEEYSEDLDECWSKYLEFASEDISTI